MNTNIKSLVFICITTLISACSGDKEDSAISADYSKIDLRWIRNYPDESKEEMLTGLYWGLDLYPH